MSLAEAVILGIIQGITEFLPISSSGHLILVESILKLEVSSLKSFDVTVHVGTLLAILIYFRKDLLDARRFPWLILGSIPAVLVGFFLEDFIDSIFRSAFAVSIMMLITGFLFFISESLSFKAKDSKLNIKNVLLIGLAQAFAIIPGVSRSGSTIFAGTLLGMKREEAARFSFLLGSIAIAGAGLLTALDIESAPINLEILFTGFLSSFLAGFFAVKWLMTYLKQHSLRIFGMYLMFIALLTLLVLK